MRKKISLSAVLFLTAFVFLAGSVSYSNAQDLFSSSLSDLVNLLRSKVDDLRVLISQNQNLSASMVGQNVQSTYIDSDVNPSASALVQKIISVNNQEQQELYSSTVPDIKKIKGFVLQEASLLKELKTLISSGSDDSEKLPPVISGISGPTSLKVGESGTWTIKAYDPNGGSLSYSVVWGDEKMNPAKSDSDVLLPQQKATFSHTYNVAGKYVPKFTVVNNRGLKASSSISVTVSKSGPLINVIYPNGGEILKIGGSYIIKWTPGDPGIKKIDLVDVNKNYVSTVYSSKVYGHPVPNTSGSFKWMVPTTTKSGFYYLRLYANSIENDNTDYSDAPFYISGFVSDDDKLYVSSTTQLPSQGIVKTNNSKPLAVFDIKTGKESVILSSIKVKFEDVANPLSLNNYLSNVGLYNGNSLISNLKNVTANYVAGNSGVEFSLNFTIPANTSRVIYVRGVTGNMNPNSNGDSLKITWDSYYGYGLSSGSTYNGDEDVAATPLLIYPSGKVTISADSGSKGIPYNQGIISPSGNVILGAFRLYAQREDMKLTDLTLDLKSDGVAKKNAISTLSIYSDDGGPLSDPVTDMYFSDIPADTFNWKSDNFLNDFVITKDSYKTIIIKGALSSNADGSQKMYLSLDNNPGWLKFIGVDSGVVYDATKDMSGPVTSKITTPYAGGSFNFNKDIVEIKKSLISPSGVVSRGTQIQYAIWDVMNVSSDLSDNFINGVTLKSKTGLPLGLSSLDKDIFALYDGDGNLICRDGVGGCVVLLDQSNGTVKFKKSSMLKVSAGIPKKISLRINTTDVSKWPSGVQFQWSIESYLDVSLDKGYVGFGGNTWSIPAVTNLITLP